MSKQVFFEKVDTEMTSIKKKRGRPKKEKEDIPVHIEIDEERFKKERDRVIKYLDNLTNRKMSTYEAISILEDLGVITETHGLSIDDILYQLREELNKSIKRR